MSVMLPNLVFHEEFYLWSVHLNGRGSKVLVQNGPFNPTRKGNPSPSGSVDLSLMECYTALLMLGSMLCVSQLGASCDRAIALLSGYALS